MSVALPPNLPPDAQHVIVFDAALPSTEQRFSVIDLTGKEPTVILKATAAHGSGSDKNRDGIAELFSNKPNSNATSLGWYRIGQAYIGKHGRSWHLLGLDSSNSNAFERMVVLHSASYVTPTRAGLSWGCPAVSKATLAALEKSGVLNRHTYLYIGKLS